MFLKVARLQGAIAQNKLYALWVLESFNLGSVVVLVRERRYRSRVGLTAPL